MSVPPGVTLRAGFPEQARETAARLYWTAFSGKLGKLMGPDDRGVRFFVRVLDPGHAISAVGPDGALLGFAGFKTDKSAFAGGSLADLSAIYGWAGALWRAPLLALLERDTSPDQLLMDGIAVVPEARGLGIGSLLLDAILDEARARGKTSVRLDVIDTNPRARALYERRGFQAIGDETTGPFARLFGFRSATRMHADLDPAPSTGATPRAGRSGSP